MLTIYDEQLSKQLRQIAAKENRPVEDILKAMVAEYPKKISSPTTGQEAIKRVRHKAYSRARQYWQSVGDTARANLTDDELDVHFGAFDEEGIPRLKQELKSLEPPVGSLAYAAKVLRETGGIQTTYSIDPSRTDDILNEEFADYLLKRMKDQNAAK